MAKQPAGGPNWGDVDSDEEEDQEVVELRWKMEEEGWSFCPKSHPVIGKLVRRFFRSRISSSSGQKKGTRQIQQTVDGRVIAYIPQVSRASIANVLIRLKIEFFKN